MAGDPYFSSVALLLHMDGVNGASVFTDSSSYAHAMEAVFGGTTSTAQKLFGTASYNVAAGSVVATPAAAELQLGASNFTIEFAVRINSGSPDGTLLLLPTTGSPTPCSIVYSNSYVVTVAGTDDSNTPVYSIPTLAGLSTNTWHRLALQRSGTTFTLFLDGVAQGTATSAATLATFTHDSSLNRGLSIGGRIGSSYLDGYIDEFRLTRLARYTGNYTPATEAFPDFFEAAPSTRPKWVQFGRAIRLPHVLGGRGKFQHEKQAMQAFIAEARTNKVFAKYIANASRGDSNIRVDVNHPSVSSRPVDGTTFTDTVQ